MNYIISGPGRIGGHLLEGIIRSCGQANVQRTHDPLLQIGQDADTTLIVVDRRNRFDALLSNALVRHTGQSTDYTNKNIKPFELNPGMFRWEYVQYIDYYNKHDLSRPYAAVFKVYFEDFVNDPAYIRRILNLQPTNVDPNSSAWQLTHNPAPYNYKDIITNWSKLSTLFDLLEKGRLNDRNHNSQPS